MRFFGEYENLYIKLDETADGNVEFKQIFDVLELNFKDVFSMQLFGYGDDEYISFKYDGEKYTIEDVSSEYENQFSVGQEIDPETAFNVREIMGIEFQSAIGNKTIMINEMGDIVLNNTTAVRKKINMNDVMIMREVAIATDEKLTEMMNNENYALDRINFNSSNSESKIQCTVQDVMDLRKRILYEKWDT